MSMTKAEKALLQNFKDAVEEALTWAALHRTEIVGRDVAPPDSSISGELSIGFDYFGSQCTYRVEPCCSSSISHGTGSHTRTNSQKPRRLFSTKLLALKAARNAIERDAAKALRNIDKQIEAEMQQGEL